MRSDAIHKKLAILAILAGTALMLTSCGKQSFDVAPSVQSVTGPGGYSIPPKVDFVMVVDDTGSMADVYSKIQSQIPSTLTQLDSMAWDYHFATIPLTKTRTVTQVAGSVYDSNRGSSWVAPYPGAVAGAIGTILASVFRLPSGTTNAYSQYVDSDDMNNALNGKEPGLDSIKNNFISSFANTNFFRKDAMTVVLVVGNGNDTSGINYCRRVDGYVVPCEEITTKTCNPSSVSPALLSDPAACGSEQSSFNQYLSFFKSFNSNLKFYAAVANSVMNNCLGGKSYVGERYQDMASALGGESFDICSQPVSSVLTSLVDQLQAQRFSYKMRYLFTDSEPNPDTLVVTRLVGGSSSNLVTIPKATLDKNGSPTSDGWVYEGYKKDVSVVYTTDSNGNPIYMNTASGYAIRLYGTAELSGDDKASVKFDPAGVKSSQTN
jgi:hypothetical protein